MESDCIVFCSYNSMIQYWVDAKHYLFHHKDRFWELIQRSELSLWNKCYFSKLPVETLLFSDCYLSLAFLSFLHSGANAQGNTSSVSELIDWQNGSISSFWISSLIFWASLFLASAFAFLLTLVLFYNIITVRGSSMDCRLIGWFVFLLDSTRSVEVYSMRAWVTYNVVVSQVAGLAFANRVQQSVSVATLPGVLVPAVLSVAWRAHVLRIVLSVSMWALGDLHCLCSVWSNGFRCLCLNKFGFGRLGLILGVWLVVLYFSGGVNWFLRLFQRGNLWNVEIEFAEKWLGIGRRLSLFLSQQFLLHLERVHELVGHEVVEQILVDAVHLRALSSSLHGEDSRDLSKDLRSEVVEFLFGLRRFIRQTTETVEAWSQTV